MSLGNELKLAAMTLASGIGLVTVFPMLPKTLTDLFDNHAGRIAVMVMLLIQSGRTVPLSIVVSVVVYVVIVYWTHAETKAMLVNAEEAGAKLHSTL